MQSWTSPGGNTLQDTNYTVTCLLSRKLSKLDEPDMQDTAGEARVSSKVMYSYGLPHMAEKKQDDQYEHTFSSYVKIRNVALKTCQKRWTIGKSGERGSGISVIAARHDDDDDDDDDISDVMLCTINEKLEKKLVNDVISYRTYSIILRSIFKLKMVVNIPKRIR